MKKDYLTGNFNGSLFQKAHNYRFVLNEDTYPEGEPHPGKAFAEELRNWWGENAGGVGGRIEKIGVPQLSKKASRSMDAELLTSIRCTDSVAKSLRWAFKGRFDRLEILNGSGKKVRLTLLDKVSSDVVLQMFYEDPFL
jgi:hypothetical protein